MTAWRQDQCEESRSDGGQGWVPRARAMVEQETHQVGQGQLLASGSRTGPQFFKLKGRDWKSTIITEQCVECDSVYMSVSLNWWNGEYQALFWLRAQT